MNTPNKWECTELGDLISVVSGHGFKKSEYSDKGVRLLQIANVAFQEINWNETAYLPIEYIESYPKLLLKPGDLVIALNRPILGRNIKFAVLSAFDCPSILYQRVGKIVINSRKIERDFLYYLMCTDYFYQELKIRLSGSDQPYINPTELVKILVSFPPLAEQKRIAAVLGKCDRLRRTRRYAVQLSETFLQSVFLQMFGDPVTNPMGWEILKLQNVCREITVGYVGSMSQEYIKKGIPFLRSQNVLPFSLDLSSIKYISSAFHNKLNKSVLYPNDVVVVRTGNAGSACVIPKNLPIANCSDLVIIRPGKDINPHYLTCLFNSSWGKGSVTGNLVGQIQQHFNIGSAKEMLVPLPPLPLQEKFAQIVQKFERFRTQQREAERQAEHLFQTLLHRAFRGELTSSDFDDEAVSALSKEIGVKQAKPKSTGEVAEYLHTKVSQQETEAVQLTLPGLE